MFLNYQHKQYAMNFSRTNPKMLKTKKNNVNPSKW